MEIILLAKSPECNIWLFTASFADLLLYSIPMAYKAVRYQLHLQKLVKRKEGKVVPVFSTAD